MNKINSTEQQAVPGGVDDDDYVTLYRSPRRTFGEDVGGALALLTGPLQDLVRGGEVTVTRLPDATLYGMGGEDRRTDAEIEALWAGLDADEQRILAASLEDLSPPELDHREALEVGRIYDEFAAMSDRAVVSALADEWGVDVEVLAPRVRGTDGIRVHLRQCRVDEFYRDWWPQEREAKRLWWRRHSSRGGERDGVRRWNGAALVAADLPAVEFLPLLGCDGYLPRGFSTLVAAFPKVGKTTLMLALIAEWTKAGHHVLYLTEEHERLWKARLTEQGGDWSRLTLIPSLGVQAAKLLGEVTGGPESIVVVDTARSVVGWKDENDNSEVEKVIRPWIVAARETGKTLVVLHHSRKAGGEGGRGISGGHALLGSFDQSLEIDGDGKRPRKITGQGRFGPVIELSYRMTDAGLVADEWTDTRSTRQQERDRQAAEDVEATERFLAAQPDHTVPARAVIQDGTGLSQVRTRAAMVALRADGRIADVPGRPSVYMPTKAGHDLGQSGGVVA